jgi:hypothetical protein
MRAGPLGLRLFLEGVEVPVISAQVSSQASNPAAATIQIVPLDSALNLLPRTCVHLFYIDDLSKKDRTLAEENARKGIDDQNRIVAHDPAYKVLFIGEVIGYNYSKAPDSRQLVLQCMDLSSYWDTCYQWFADYSAQGDGLTDKAHVFIQAGEGKFDNIASGHDWVISRLLSSPPLSPEYSMSKGLQAGMIHLLEAVGGIRPRASTFAGYGGANDFFTVAELRYNLLGMLGAVSKDTTAAKIFSAKAFIKWMKSGMSSIGNLVSFRDIIRHVGTYYVPSGSKPITYPNPDTWETEYPEISENLKVAQSSLFLIIANMEKLTNYTYISPLTKSNMLIAKNRATVALDKTKKSKAINKGPAIKDIQEAIINMKIVETNLKTLQANTYLADRSNEMAGDTTLQTQIIDPLEKAAKLINKTLQRKNSAMKNKTIQDGAHLYSQLLLPETFFVPPPRCNVLFPDQYYSFTYNRNFMREITRLSCHSGLGILAGASGAKLLGTFYFAPSVRGVSSDKESMGKTLHATLSRGARILLPHELHSGVIPKFEWVVDGHRWGIEKNNTNPDPTDPFAQKGKVGYIQRLATFQFFQHRWMSRSMAVEARFNPRLVLGFPCLVIDRPPKDFMVESAGMPGSPDGQVTVTSLNIPTSAMPTQYLGKIAALTHNVSQSGGTTSIAFTHCRTHRGKDDEFLQMLMREKMKESCIDTVIDVKQLLEVSVKGKGSDKSKISILGMYLTNDLNPDKIIGGYGKVVVVKPSAETVMISKQKADAIGLTAAIFSQSVANNDDLLTDQTVSAPTANRESNTDDANTDVGPASRAPTPYRGKEGYFGAFDAMEVPAAPIVDPTSGSVDTDKQQTVTTTSNVPAKLVITFKRWVSTGEWERSNLSIEDAMMPGWYDQIWKKATISKEVYLPLIGCRAITDDESVDMATLSAQRKAELETSAAYTTLGPTDANTNVTQTETGGDVAVYNVPLGTLEQAIDGLVISYGMMKWKDQDVHAFIDSYTSRPIASMIDILGSQDLEFGPDGLPTKPSMIEGFHSRAFGDYNSEMFMNKDGMMVPGTKSLFNLSYPLAEGYPQMPAGTIKLKPLINRGEKNHPAIPAQLDPRGRARARVKEYAAEMRKSIGHYAG